MDHIRIFVRWRRYYSYIVVSTQLLPVHFCNKCVTGHAISMNRLWYTLVDFSLENYVCLMCTCYLTLSTNRTSNSTEAMAGNNPKLSSRHGTR